MPLVRDARPEDAAACAAIYAPYVRDTTVSFELEPPSAEEMAARVAAAQRDHAWLVVEDGGRVAGYAYGSPFRARAAYRFTAEVSVYLSPDATGRGLGRTLYEALLARLSGLGYRTAVAGMSLPNPASEALHRALGFTPVGVFHDVGTKFGRDHDVLFVERPLAPA